MVSRLAQRGFTLLELLLVVVLLLLFASVAVFNLTPLRQGAELNEGVGQLESLLRFARAEAAEQGRRVQVQLSATTTATDGSTNLPTSTVQVSWEPQPLVNPGVFVADASTAPLAQSVENLVRIEEVRRLGAAGNPTPTNAVPTASETNSVADSSDLPAVPPPLDVTNTDAWPAIMFYPDGSSDSAEILVASNDTSDPRRMLVHWNGLSGTATYQEASPSDSTGSGDNPSTAAQPLEPASVANSAMGQGAP